MNAACPYTLYLGRLAPNSQRSIASQLNSIADLLRWPEKKREMMYHKIDFQQASHIKALLIANGWSARSAPGLHLGAGPAKPKRVADTCQC